MADREAPYDPYIPAGGQGGGGQQPGNQRTAALQAVGLQSLQKAQCWPKLEDEADTSGVSSVADWMSH